MGEGVDWAAMRDRRFAEPGAAEAYDAARLDYERTRAERHGLFDQVDAEDAGPHEARNRFTSADVDWLDPLV
ncbi:hypothetical protein Q0Z83_109710 [Actinoplanes sichuanensis]|uniref:Uncharacterized protein n=1 Tax=Actinoplanes sichuanensis TaxID=512349 RepID=A0ABW4A1Z6_9ACTN|nr:hypothetical protein [Actinoplanes sichuanensis]BEL12780.1 hypothetical protein Q0Z83_109710 [Actinoplanes sichuanensis]